MTDATRQPRLWVIDPSVSRPEAQGVAEILQDWTGTSRVFRPCLNPEEGPGPETGYDTDGVVVMGSAASVYDDLKWMDDLAAWLRPLVLGDPEIPVLGICFGHQLIAHLAGGRVAYLHPDRSKALGVSSTSLEGGRLVPGKRDLRVAVSHREVVEEVPPGYRVTARRPLSSNDGLEHETRPIFSFQFHPEAREEFACRSGFDTGLIDTELREDGQSILSAFRRLLLRFP